MTTTAAPAADVYALPQEFVDFRDMLRQIVDERVRPRAVEIDTAGGYPWDIRRLFAEQDLLGLPFPTQYMMRGAKVTQIYEGTNEIQRVVIARATA